MAGVGRRVSIGQVKLNFQNYLFSHFFVSFGDFFHLSPFGPSENQGREQMGL